MAEECKQVRAHCNKQEEMQKKAKKLNKQPTNHHEQIKSKRLEVLHYGLCTAYQVILMLAGRDAIICVPYFQEENVVELGTSTYLV